MAFSFLDYFKNDRVLFIQCQHQAKAIGYAHKRCKTCKHRLEVIVRCNKRCAGCMPWCPVTGRPGRCWLV
ncbi:hypothetical protein L596_000392 [Steinernema carpocapsae]|uniref:Uncharacterized protein n=1 Tax=Steinernema carpocapsae TaxID=34508 RepID=A0A4U8UI15_STECR|nr:hypothetical protein L596_000392 [Steinernema carpocapsae]